MKRHVFTSIMLKSVCYVHYFKENKDRPFSLRCDHYHPVKTSQRKQITHKCSDYMATCFQLATWISLFRKRYFHCHTNNTAGLKRKLAVKIVQILCMPWPVFLQSTKKCLIVKCSFIKFIEVFLVNISQKCLRRLREKKIL